MIYNYYLGDSNTLMFKVGGYTTWAMLATREDKKWTLFADYGFGFGYQYRKRKQIPDLYVILKGKTL